jgi:hypothetical protein
MQVKHQIPLAAITVLVYALGETSLKICQISNLFWLKADTFSLMGTLSGIG